MNVLEYRPWYQNPLTQSYSDEIAAGGQDRVRSAERVMHFLLASKGLSDEASIERFLQPRTQTLRDPFLFRDMLLACEVITQVITDGGKILIYGDYDCDGLTSTALLVRFFRSLGADAVYMIPDRLQDGYGLGEDSVGSILARRPDLVITVDCGISSQAEIRELMESGVPTILTDHHQPGDELPLALAVINPQVADETYPFAHLAGVGVALKLVQGLAAHLKLDAFDLSPYICLAALGTVADAMPLEDENRIIVAQGIQLFKEHAPLGLRVLSQTLRPDGEIQASFFGFSIAPRLNAAGRIGHLEPAVRLLLSDDPAEVEQAAQDLEALNEQRRELEQTIYRQAAEQIEAMPRSEKKHIILVGDPDWHSGVVGIVSARLVEKYRLPVITFAGYEGELRGSARSCGRFDILAAIRAASDYTVTFGGHLQAAGVTVTPEHYAEFRRQVIAYAAANPVLASEVEQLKYQFELPHHYLNEELASGLTEFEPFGQGNERPAFVLRGVTFEYWRLVGQGQHISVSVRLDDGRTIRAIAFQAKEFQKLFRIGDQADLLVHLNWNEWNGRSTLQLQILDWHVPQTGHVLWDEPERVEKAYRITTSIAETARMYQLPVRQLAVGKAQISQVFLQLQAWQDELSGGFDLALLTRALVRELKSFMTPFVLQRMLDMFGESGLLEYLPAGSAGYVLNLFDHEALDGTALDLRQTATWLALESQGALI